MNEPAGPSTLIAPTQQEVARQRARADLPRLQKARATLDRTARDEACRIPDQVILPLRERSRPVARLHSLRCRDVAIAKSERTLSGS
jgi:hypothetical protein